MKLLRKADIVQSNHIARVKAERDIMAAANNEWIVRLFFSFHDQDHLYFIMEYVPVCAPSRTFMKTLS
jgi:serine/threonine protein kinase